MKKIKKIHGYTLIEVMLSMFFLAVCILFIISVFPTATSAIKKAENVEVATNLGDKELEYNRRLSFASISGYSGTYTYNGFRNGANYTQNFIYNVTVSDISSDLKDVLINITWAEKSSSNHSLRMETVVFNETI
ncbi:MAG: hypothetical protein ABIH00_04820 [Armatimonadota bacterium]